MVNKRILIVDDDKAISTLLGRIVSGAYPDFEVRMAQDGASALEQFQQQEFDLMFTDYNMPKMNGLQLARTVQKISPDTRIVLMSGQGSSLFDIEKTFPSNLNGFISKPISFMHILNIVKHVMA